MKKLTIFFLAIMFMLSNQVCMAYDDFSLSVNRIVIDKRIIKDSDIYYIPVRTVFEAVGAEVLWQGEEQSIDIVFKDMTCKLKVDSSEIIVNGAKKQISVPVKLFGDYSYMCLCALNELRTCTIRADTEEKKIEIIMY